MTLLDLYQKYIALVELFIKKANSTTDSLARESLRSRAIGFQSDAGYLAHCLAMLGNLSLTDIPVNDLTVQVEKLNCVLENPWRRGLGIIQREIQGDTP